MPKNKPEILCVDDEPELLRGLKLHLRKKYKVTTANSGPEALALVEEREEPFALIISDMRMPEMTGAALLQEMCQRQPNTVRMLLTGQTDLDNAIAAINEGQIYRFLTKPCPPPQLLEAVEQAMEQHRLLHAERQLLEQTLRGSIQALTEVLALTHPAIFGRCTRIKGLVRTLGQALHFTPLWQLEVAAMLSHVACVTLSPYTMEKIYIGKSLEQEERVQVGRIPIITNGLLSSIPRLEEVLEMITNIDWKRHIDLSVHYTSPRKVPIGTSILELVMDYDVLEAQGFTAVQSVDALILRKGRYHPEVLETFSQLKLTGHQRVAGQSLFLRDVTEGMVFLEDVRNLTGALIIARGHQVTPSMLERLQNFPRELLNTPILATAATS